MFFINYAYIHTYICIYVNPLAKNSKHDTHEVEEKRGRLEVKKNINRNNNNHH